jgi:hypothetical protein
MNTNHIETARSALEGNHKTLIDQYKTNLADVHALQSTLNDEILAHVVHELALSDAEHTWAEEWTSDTGGFSCPSFGSAKFELMVYACTAATIFRFLRVSGMLTRSSAASGLSAKSWDMMVAPQIHPLLRTRGPAHDAHLAFNRTATPSPPFYTASLPSTADLRSTWPSPRVSPVVGIVDL